MATTSLAESLDGFRAANGAFLRGLGLVDPLVDEVWRRIETGAVGSRGAFGVAEDGGVVTAADLAPREAVVVFAHQWVFETVTGAEQALFANEGLRAAVVDLVSMATGKQPFSHEEEQNEQDSVLWKNKQMEFALKNLFRVAFEFDVEAEDGQQQKMSCVTFDPYAPALLPFANSPLFGAAIFVDARTAKSYTVLWPNWIDTDEEVDDDELILEAFSPVTRGEITIMPDFSATGFWEHHYATSKETTKFDWYVPWSTDLSELIKNSVITSSNSKNSLVTVLNVGAGNSTSVGDGMVEDGIADVVIHFDISKEVVHALAKMEVESLKLLEQESKDDAGNQSRRRRHGLQEFIVFDAACLNPPFRKPSSSKLFDWAFDKGTFDGMMSAGIDVVRKVWANLAILTDTVVLVSHGKPERRIQLIEEEIGSNWEVDQCLEIDTTKTTGWCYWVYICRQKKSTTSLSL